MNYELCNIFMPQNLIGFTNWILMLPKHNHLSLFLWKVNLNIRFENQDSDDTSMHMPMEKKGEL